ncbi:MAG: hypothetical protein K0V04_43495 [Deltaproteobacteria bacterium]|nr:hypothetical protein [Deltaproteobacteria bacterium]
MAAPANYSPNAAANFREAPAWVRGPSRVYPRDGTFAYQDLFASASARPDTPLLCEITFDRMARSRWLSADVVTGVELDVVYWVDGVEPPLRASGPRSAAYVSLLDPTSSLDESTWLQFDVSDRDLFSGRLFSSHDHLGVLRLHYADELSASTGVQRRGRTDVSCRHLDPEAAAMARLDALARYDEIAEGQRPVLHADGLDFGLGEGGTGRKRRMLLRAASLSRWSDPEIQVRSDLLLQEQLCFERSAAEAVDRRVKRSRHWWNRSYDGFELEATAFVCTEAADTTGGPCTLTVTATNLSREAGRVPALDADTVVLAGGREVHFTLHTPVHDVAPGDAVELELALEPVVAVDVPLSRPKLLRSRRRTLGSRRVHLSDFALWPRASEKVRTLATGSWLPPKP